MAVIHSTASARSRPPIAMSISDTVQLPPMKSLTPPPRAACITARFTGSSTMTASSRMRRVEAASIQYPCHPAARRRGWTASV